MKTRQNISGENIIAEAAVLLQQYGSQALSLPQLAARLGCSEQMLTNHFADTGVLLTAVIRTYATRHLTLAVSVMTDPGGRPIRERLMCFGIRLLLVMRDDQDALSVYRCVIADASRTDIGLFFYEAGLRDLLEKLTYALDIAMIRGELRMSDPGVMARQLFSLLYVAFERRMLEREPQHIALCQIRKLVREAVSLFLHGVIKSSHM